MKISTLLIIVLTVFSGISNAQKSKITGSWLMTKAEMGTEVQNPYQITEFNENGEFMVMGMEAGTWTYNEKNNSIVLKSELDEDFNGEGKILNLNEKELIIDKAGVKMYYQKVDLRQIQESNKNSDLFGMWEFKDVPYSEATTLVTFTEPDEFAMIQKEEGMSANLSGTWIFNDQNSSLIMIGLRSEDTFHGENKVVKIDTENLELENNGTVYKGHKKVQNATKIERLDFTEDVFYKEDGDYKYYDDAEKLPWRDWGEMKTGLLNTKQLVYNYSTLISDTETLETKTLTANVMATPEEEGFTIDNVFNGYDRYNLPEDTEFYTSSEYTKPLYPVEDDIFRVVGDEEITTPAGRFDCTVVEAMNDSGVVKKLWMINDKIGVYAKIIEDDPDENWGHYSVFELQEIK